MLLTLQLASHNGSKDLIKNGMAMAEANRETNRLAAAAASSDPVLLFNKLLVEFVKAQLQVAESLG